MKFFKYISSHVYFCVKDLGIQSYLSIDVWISKKKIFIRLLKTNENKIANYFSHSHKYNSHNSQIETKKKGSISKKMFDPQQT